MDICHVHLYLIDTPHTWAKTLISSEKKYKKFCQRSIMIIFLMAARVVMILRMMMMKILLLLLLLV